MPEAYIGNTYLSDNLSEYKKRDKIESFNEETARMDPAPLIDSLQNIRHNSVQRSEYSLQSKCARQDTDTGTLLWIYPKADTSG